MPCSPLTQIALAALQGEGDSALDIMWRKKQVEAEAH